MERAWKVLMIYGGVKKVDSSNYEGHGDVDGVYRSDVVGGVDRMDNSKDVDDVDVVDRCDGVGGVDGLNSYN